MSSIRSRIEAFEAMSKKSEDSSKDKKNESRKRFRNPGSNRRGAPEQEDSVRSIRDFISMSKTASKTQDLSDLESDLQEVWSVRKNIHHNGAATKQATTTGSGNSSSMPSVQVKAGQYSRHGAIPAQQTQGPSVLFPSKESQSKGFPFETKRTPLQENNSKDSTPWNVKTSSYSYNSQDAARKQEHHAPEEKVSYAKKMAQGYLKSMGMGEYTPKTGGYAKQPQSEQHQTWKKVEDDFDFSEPKSNPERRIDHEAPIPTDSAKPTQFSHAKENQAMGGSAIVHKSDDEGVGETLSKSNDAVKSPRVDETVNVKWQRAPDYNFDFSKAYPPMTHKKDIFDIATPSEENRAQEHRQPNEKLNYAKRMAQGYLKSEGLGVYTPKTSSHVKQTKPNETQERKKADNEGSKTPERRISSEYQNGRTANEEKKAVCVTVSPESEHHKTNEKLNYAKRMAQGYLKAEGLGVYSPQTSNYVKQTDKDHSHSTWMRLDTEEDDVTKTKSSERKISSEKGLSSEDYTEKDHHHPPPEKLSYAKRMAKGYLKSVGMGQYTPKTSGHAKQSKPDESQKQSSSTWKNLKGSDEQDFEFDL